MAYINMINHMSNFVLLQKSVFQIMEYRPKLYLSLGFFPLFLPCLGLHFAKTKVAQNVSLLNFVRRHLLGRLCDDEAK